MVSYRTLTTEVAPISSAVRVSRALASATDSFKSDVYWRVSPPNIPRNAIHKSIKIFFCRIDEAVTTPISLTILRPLTVGPVLNRMPAGSAASFSEPVAVPVPVPAPVPVTVAVAVALGLAVAVAAVVVVAVAVAEDVVAVRELDVARLLSHAARR